MHKAPHALGDAMNDFFKKNIFNPLFLLGLSLRVILVCLISPRPVTDWYLPFLTMSIDPLNWDPWGMWIAHGGTPIAFPYGYVMWVSFLPLIYFCHLLNLPEIFGYNITLIIADALLLDLLKKITPQHDKLLLGVYWLSPIVIIATYGLGFNDLIPILWLTLAIYAIQQLKPFYSGLTCIAAVSAKLSMILALPFFCLYIIKNKSIREFSLPFLKGLLLGITIAIIPFLFSKCGVNMLSHNPEMGKIYFLTIKFTNNTSIYLVPLLYCLMLYATWQIKRVSFDLFYAALGITFLLVVLMTPASLGWFIWTIPILIFYQTSSDRMASSFCAVFSILYTINSLLFVIHDNTEHCYIPPLLAQLLTHFDASSFSLIYTAMITTGIILAYRLWQKTISQNDYFRLSQKPFVIGIAGDSGSGKDTLSTALQCLFGKHSVALLTGDNYHLWDRQKPIWKAVTHLNPIANDLEKMVHDVLALISGKNIQSKQYDHSTGHMSHPSTIKSNDVIIVSGLHALYLPILRDCYNLSIYLDMDDNLRQYFKYQRDTTQRAHTREELLASCKQREPDATQFIKPQEIHAELILSVQSTSSITLDDLFINTPINLRLVARSRHGLNDLSLRRVLIGICGLNVDFAIKPETGEGELTIEGNVDAQEIMQAARIMCPKMFEFLHLQPQFKDGIIGIMQIVTLAHINQSLLRRFI